MSYFGQPRGRRKVLQTVRIVFNGAGGAQLSYDGGALGSVTTCNTTTWLELFSSSTMTATVNMINIADDIGELMQFGTGGTNGINNAPADQLMISELGGPGFITIRVDAGTRLAVKPVVNNPTLGTSMVINFFD